MIGMMIMKPIIGPISKRDINDIKYDKKDNINNKIVFF